MIRTLAILGAIGLGAASAAGQGDPGFQRVGTLVGRGGLFASAVGPGPAAGSERYYLSYLYEDSTFEVVGVNPDTGSFHIFPSPVEGESAARCMVAGPDGNMYLGSCPHAHLLKLDTKTETLVDLGMPSAPGEQFIWSVAFGSDGRLYGGTYPHAKLVRYDPVSGDLDDLGSMDPVEQYAHYVAASGDGFIYVGIGTSRANIAAYRISTDEHREILPQEFQVTGQAGVYRGNDGKVYGTLGSLRFRLEGWNAIPILGTLASRPSYQNRLHDGRRVTPHGDALRILDPATNQSIDRPFSYRGKELKLFRICLGHDGAIYGSSELPANLVRLRDSTSAFEELDGLGSGEVYSLLFQGSNLLLGAYGCGAPLMVFDPATPSAPGPGAANPQLLQLKGVSAGWRPKAMVQGPDGKVYVGSDAGYGRLGGVLAAWDVAAGTAVAFQDPVADQSVTSLAVAGSAIVGGTSVTGGGGSHPTQKEARLFVWDTRKQGVVLELAPVPGSWAGVNDLVTAPNGRVYGMTGDTVFAFDPATGIIRTRRSLSSGIRGPIYNAAALGPDGRIWGLASTGVFAIDPVTCDSELVATPPSSITGGFALQGGAVYLVCAASVYRYELPGGR